MSTATENTDQVGSDPITEKREAFAAGLRALADLIEAKPDAYSGYTSGMNHELYLSSAKEMASTALAIGGRWDKEVLDQYFYLRRDLGGGVQVTLSTARHNVCERVQVGTETRKVPDPKLVEEIPLVEIEEPVFEWRCPDSLLDLRAQDFVSDEADEPQDIPF